MFFLTTTLVFIARQILIYGGLSMIMFGMFGSLMVILIFSRPPLSQNPCSLYIVINGILSFFFLPLYYLPNIVTFGFQINWLALNTPFCKFQMSYGAFTVTSVFVINCFISLNRYAIISRSPRIRSFNSKKITRILIVIGLLFVWCLIGLPVAILFENISFNSNETYICTSNSTILLAFAALIYYPILEGILPIVLAILFWRLIRNKVQRLNNQELMQRFDQQITRMYLFQIIANAIASFPFAIINLYRAATMQIIRSATQEDILQFFRLMAIWLFYVQYCSDYYIYILTSSEMRAETAKILCFWCHHWKTRVVAI